jgi:hypothetical protein
VKLAAEAGYDWSLHISDATLLALVKGEGVVHDELLQSLSGRQADVTPPLLLWRQMLRLRRWWLSRWGQLSRERCVLCRQGVPHAAARA